MKKYLILVITAVVSSAAIAFAADSATIVRKGNALYKQQKYGDALKLYDKALEKQPDSSIIHFNKGASQFKAEDFEAAIGSFEKASATQDRSLEAKANYNLANSKYKLGQSRKESDLASAVSLLGEALERYRRAIELDPKDNDAKLNYELVEKEYRDLKQKLEQQAKEQQGQEQQAKEQQGQEQQAKEQQGQ
ncbi:MAG TPA: tetratricopeptide repeat protein, partial [Candidatus Omnitrophota bacterium]|nr:tetratricopeptide repeat protein [Candidatus Omnitrophota bacterium]